MTLTPRQRWRKAIHQVIARNRRRASLARRRRKKNWRTWFHRPRIAQPNNYTFLGWQWNRYKQLPRIKYTWAEKDKYRIRFYK